MKCLRWISAVLLLSVILPGSPAALADDTVGVVLMHGKDGTQMSRSPIGKLAYQLEGDFKVEIPEMSWSRDNGFNGTLDKAFKDIDAAVDNLKSAGATKIVIGGHSMGAATALAYATQRDGLTGLLLIAPGHRPDKRARDNQDALDKAKQLVAAGNVSEEVIIQDRNQGKSITRTLPADIALSWFDPNGLAVMENAAPKVRPGPAVLLIIGERDRFHPEAKQGIFDQVPANDKNAYTVVPGGHKATPTKGAAEIAAWLNSL